MNSPSFFNYSPSTFSTLLPIIIQYMKMKFTMQILPRARSKQRNHGVLDAGSHGKFSTVRDSHWPPPSIYVAGELLSNMGGTGTLSISSRCRNLVSSIDQHFSQVQPEVIQLMTSDPFPLFSEKHSPIICRNEIVIEGKDCTNSFRMISGSCRNFLGDNWVIRTAPMLWGGKRSQAPP